LWRKAKTRRQGRGQSRTDGCQFAARFLTEHAEAKREASAAAEYRLLLERVVLPALGKKRVADVTRRDVAKLHRRDHYRPTD
jgi:hypothetical protein